MKHSCAIDVLHVVEAFGGGVAAAVRDYVRDLPEARHHIVCRLRPEADALGAQWREDFASVTAITGGHLGAVRTVRETIRELRPSVVHSHSSYAGAWARTAGIGLDGFRSVYTPHAWAFAGQDKSSLERGAFRVVERALLRRTDVLAGCSRAELAPARAWRSDVELAHVPNIADVETLSAPALRREPADLRGLLIVGSGRLAAQKDPAWFRAAVEAVRAEGHAVRAMWVGGGDQQMQAQLESAGIEVTGWIPLLRWSATWQRRICTCTRRPGRASPSPSSRRRAWGGPSPCARSRPSTRCRCPSCLIGPRISPSAGSGSLSTPLASRWSLNRTGHCARTAPVSSTTGSPRPTGSRSGHGAWKDAALRHGRARRRSSTG